MRNLGAPLVLALGFLLAGCAETTGVTDAGDPLESWNRQVFAMNQKFDHVVLKPTVEAYNTVVPEPARNGVHNFISNIDSPVVFANDLLQGEVSLASQTVGRFGLNSTLGLAGLVDVATPAGIPYHSSDFGQTLGVWGVGDKPYLVLPLLGPSNPRDAVGFVADNFMDPLMYVGIRSYTYWDMGKGAAEIVDERARNAKTLDDLENSSVDEYASERSLYKQFRDAKIRHGQTDVKDLPSY